MESRHVSVVIARPPEAVCAYAADADHLSRWASGLAEGDVRRDGDDLVVASPMGEVRVAFVAANDWGVLDHDVTLPTGEVVTNPLRVVAHPDGSEVLFTVRRLGMTTAELDRDAATVAEDLSRLKELVEGAS